MLNPCSLTLILSIAVGAVIAMNFCLYGCLNYRRSLGEALIIDGLKLKNRTNKFRKNPDEQIPRKSGRKKSEQNFRRKIKTRKKMQMYRTDRGTLFSFVVWCSMGIGCHTGEISQLAFSRFHSAVESPPHFEWPHTAGCFRSHGASSQHNAALSLVMDGP